MFSFLRDHYNYFLMCTQLIISGKCFVFTHFQSITEHYKQRTAWKASLQSIQLLRKYRMLDHQSPRPSYWYKSGCIALTRCISMLCFASSYSNIWLTFQPKNNTRRALLALHLPKSHTEAIRRVTQIVTYVAVEKGMEYKGEQRRASWCKHWSCSDWRKGMSQDEATSNSAKSSPLP